MPLGRTKNIKKPRNRANKVNLVFDEQKRREFLTGFHKRKVQRKKQAKEQFEKDLKEEKKRIKAEAKESYKKLVVSHRPIPELKDILDEEYEDENTTVKIVELSTNDIAKQNNWIGANEPKYPSDIEENDETDAETENIPGMELHSKKKSKRMEKPKFNSEKDVKKKLKKLATRTVQKSKIFQMKNRMERQKQKKKSLRQKKLKEKFKEKSKNKGGRFK